MKDNKIIPCLWFHTDGGKIYKLVEYYKKVFGKSFKGGKIISLGETPGGYTEMCEVSIFSQKYLLMTTSKKHHVLNDAISLMIYCDDQPEIDKYWNYFTRAGQESQCGWCMDRYGLRWQVIPKNLDKLMSRPNGWQVMMKQKKIVIKEYFK